MYEESGTNAAIYECFETIWAILVDDKHSVEWHITEFEKMAENLCGYTKSCVISFIDIYKKVERNFRGAREVSKKDRIILGKEFIKIAGKSGMTIRPCAEGDVIHEAKQESWIDHQ